MKSLTPILAFLPLIAFSLLSRFLPHHPVPSCQLAPGFRPPREVFCDQETDRCMAPTQMGAKWGAIIGRHQAASGRLERSIPEIEKA